MSCFGRLPYCDDRVRLVEFATAVFPGTAMSDDSMDPSENPKIDPESTFALIERVRDGDAQALERLFARHLEPLQRWASARLRGR